ncbi:hypothetical protein GGQ74_000479 [Desulfobaculum xiamenense]|uniref:Uncharacterized protein n=1 Tax=Desulfobaculum xiamenense TaxID=995050 RepID=A0A846QQ78_9BACT|nr:hypothetical protein [Desulfobaculum xiamenense]NJB66839.1 hypothetical protein [Desulfobaculum xiamenense]
MGNAFANDGVMEFNVRCGMRILENSMLTDELTERFDGHLLRELTASARFYPSSPDSLVPYWDGPALYTFDVDGVPFEFFTNLKRDAHRVYAFGTASRDNLRILPRFDRWRWAFAMRDSVIVYNDPTRYLGGLRCGWCLGTAQNPYLPCIAAILRGFVQALGRRFEELVLFGSSAGGFTSLMLGAMLRGASVVVNNAHTDVLLADEAAVSRLLRVCFGGISARTARERYPTRLRVMDFYHHQRYMPRIFFAQNARDSFHMQRHFLPFAREAQTLRESGHDWGRQLFVEVYSCRSGHAPLPYERMMARFALAERLFDG